MRLLDYEIGFGGPTQDRWLEIFKFLAPSEVCQADLEFALSILLEENIEESSVQFMTSDVKITRNSDGIEMEIDCVPGLIRNYIKLKTSSPASWHHDPSGNWLWAGPGIIYLRDNL